MAQPGAACISDDGLSADDIDASDVKLTKLQLKNRKAQRKFRERQKDKQANLEQEVTLHTSDLLLSE